MKQLVASLIVTIAFISNAMAVSVTARATAFKGVTAGKIESREIEEAVKGNAQAREALVNKLGDKVIGEIATRTGLKAMEVKALITKFPEVLNTISFIQASTDASATAKDKETAADLTKLIKELPSKLEVGESTYNDVVAKLLVLGPALAQLGPKAEGLVQEIAKQLNGGAKLKDAVQKSIELKLGAKADLETFLKDLIKCKV